MTSHAIIKAEMTDQAKAEKHFREVLRRGSGRSDILAVIADEPQAALARLNETRALTDKGSADMLDEIVGQIPDTARARELLEQELPAARLHKLLAARGDLASSAAYVVSLEDILHAVFSDISELMHEDEADRQNFVQVIHRESSDGWTSEESLEFDDEEGDASAVVELDINSPAPLYALRAWAYKLKDREDYEEFLGANMGGFSLLQCILLAVWHDTGCPEIVDHCLDAHTLDELGIDHDTANEAMLELFEAGPPSFSRAEIEDARLQIAKRRKAREEAPSLTEETRDQAARVAEELDF